ncbi:MAG: superoxide dismutase [Firmicutes bacterium]|nr:superoxide dismutase [Bacillota bacterium]
MMQRVYPFKPLNFGFTFDQFEPYIDTKTMDVHVTRHYYGYVNNLNSLLKPYPKYQTATLYELATGADVPQTIKNQAGGVLNHEHFFYGLDNKQSPTYAYPDGRVISDVDLQKQLTQAFGSVDNFKQQFRIAALSVFGSGYTWLVKGDKALLDPSKVIYSAGDLHIVKTANQDALPKDLLILLSLDVWEHAYYLKNLNDRGAYIDNWFSIVL